MVAEPLTRVNRGAAALRAFQSRESNGDVASPVLCVRTPAHLTKTPFRSNVSALALIPAIADFLLRVHADETL